MPLARSVADWWKRNFSPSRPTSDDYLEWARAMGEADRIREAAFIEGLAILAGRQGLSDQMSQEDRDAVRAYDGPVVLGKPTP